MKNLFKALTVIFTLLFAFNAIAETLFVSIPMESLYKKKYAIGMGVMYDLDSLKFEHGCQQKDKDSENYKKYSFTEITYSHKFSQLLNLELGTGFDHITLETNQGKFLEEYHTKIVISRGFQFKKIELAPSVIGEIPISNLDDVYSNYLSKRIRFALDLNYYF